MPLWRQEFLARGQAEPVWSPPWLSGLVLLELGATFREGWRWAGGLMSCAARFGGPAESKVHPELGS